MKWTGDLLRFTRPVSLEAQEFAKVAWRMLGRKFEPNRPSDGAPCGDHLCSVGSLVPGSSLKVVRKGGIVVCGGIHMKRLFLLFLTICFGDEAR
jgi:propanol-preferring alcohol dehydrogenase